MSSGSNRLRVELTLDRREPCSLDQAGLLVAEAPFRGWISGGHALELHIGESWRSHQELDVEVCKSQAAEAHSRPWAERP
jgi:hypothetical protein